MSDYCDITNDLQRAFAQIEEYQMRKYIDSWVVSSGAIYKKTGVGYTANLWVTETPYSLAGSASVSAGEFYYDADVDTLYIRLTGDGDPNDVEVSTGEDWDGYKTAMRDKAQQMVDSYLNNKYVTPLIPRSRKLHDTADYEYPIVLATALCTCWLIASRINPGADEVIALHKQFYNPDPEPGEIKGLINQLIDGDMVLQDQISVREVGSWNIYPSSSNSIDTTPILSGVYSGSAYKVWRIQVDAAGVPGTGTFKVSYDGGTNWDITTQDMKDASEDEYRMSITDGIYVYWPNVSYGDGDYWDIELHPLSDTATNAKIGSIAAVR